MKNKTKLTSELTPGLEEIKQQNLLDRRKFISGLTTATLAMTIVPRHVLGGNGYIAPSDKINVAYIGLGTQGLRQLVDIIKLPEVQITAVCDPQRKAINYYDWDNSSLRNEMRELIGNQSWNTGGNNTIPGGLNNGKEIVDAYYQKTNGKKYDCHAYTDFREMFAKEKDLNAVQVMTPDHLHGIICAAAIKRNIGVSVHKPLSTRLLERRYGC